MPRPLSEADVESFRERLIDVATRQFAQHGLDGVTMRSLAAELGVSAMTPYRYFKDKDAILAAVQARAFNRFADALEAPLAVSGSPAEQARAVGQAYSRFAFANPEGYRLMFDAGLAAGMAYPDLERASTRARRTMTRYVQGLVGAGIFEGDPELIGHVFWAAIHGAVMLELAGRLSPGFDFAAVMRAANAALTEGFRKR